jgi:hypothetical protein
MNEPEWIDKWILGNISKVAEYARNGAKIVSVPDRHSWRDTRESVPYTEVNIRAWVYKNQVKLKGHAASLKRLAALKDSADFTEDLAAIETLLALVAKET